MNHTTGTQIAYLHLCHRKLWLFANGISMEHTSDLVAEDKQIDEYSYPQRADKWQEVAIEGIRIDHFDAVNGIIREVKKSNYSETQWKDFKKGFEFPTINNFRQELIAGHWEDWIAVAIESNNFKIDVLCSNLLPDYLKYCENKDFIRANQLLVSVYFYETKAKPDLKKRLRVAYDLEYDKYLGYKKKVFTVDEQFL